MEHNCFYRINFWRKKKMTKCWNLNLDLKIFTRFYFYKYLTSGSFHFSLFKEIWKYVVDYTINQAWRSKLLVNNNYLRRFHDVFISTGVSVSLPFLLGNKVWYFQHTIIEKSPFSNSKRSFFRIIVSNVM